MVIAVAEPAVDGTPIRQSQNGCMSAETPNGALATGPSANALAAIPASSPVNADNLAQLFKQQQR
jgi:hypothetical protein